jgi:Protein of unknown function (DUF3102)
MSVTVPLPGNNKLSGADLSCEANAQLAEHAIEIRRLGNRVTEDIVAIGEHLIAAKKLVGHGHWHSWLEQEFGWKDRTAQRFMSVARALTSNASGLTDLDASLEAVYSLASPTTPPEVIHDVAALGRKVTIDDVARARGAHKVSQAKDPVSPQINTGRRRALAPPAPPKPAPKPAEPTTPAVDPIDDVAYEIIAKCDDSKWRPSIKIASAVKRAETSVREALKSLGDCVAQRKNENGEIEYRIERGGEALLRRTVAAKDVEIADRDREIVSLKNQIAEKDAEIERLTELLTAPPRPAASSKKASVSKH